MWNRFSEWHKENDTEIRWFFVGVFTMLLMKDLSAGDWLSSLVDALLIYFNIWAYRKE